MEAAKAAVSEFTSRHGHHDTKVEELVRPAVTSEQIKPHRHEEATQAIDREIHKHHHHTTVQPIKHQEILPEKHIHQAHDVETQEFMHGSPEETQKRLATEAAQFKNTSMTHEVHHTHAAAPTVTSEHVHHHVHETVQPIIHKEIISPEVVHTTKPLHEIHHHHAEHHGMSALPMKTLDEFKKAGGILTGGKSASHETYEGDPRPYNKDLQTDMASLGLNRHGHPRHHHDTQTGADGAAGSELGSHDESSGTGLTGTDARNGTTGTTGTTSSDLNGIDSSRMGVTGAETGQGPVHNSKFANAVDPRVNSDPAGQSMGKSSYPSEASTTYSNTAGQAPGDEPALGDESKTRQGPSTYTNYNPVQAGNDISATNHGNTASQGVGNEHSLGDESKTRQGPSTYTNYTFGQAGNDTAIGTGKKPSLASRLNPFKDSDGDGKKGVGE